MFQHDCNQDGKEHAHCLAELAAMKKRPKEKQHTQNQHLKQKRCEIWSEKQDKHKYLNI